MLLKDSKGNIIKSGNSFMIPKDTRNIQVSSQKKLINQLKLAVDLLVSTTDEATYLCRNIPSVALACLRHLGVKSCENDTLYITNKS